MQSQRDAIQPANKQTKDKETGPETNRLVIKIRAAVTQLCN